MKDSDLLKLKASPSHPYLEEIQEMELTFKRYQEAMIKILLKWPHEFESDLFRFFLRFWAMSDEFTLHRTMRHHLRLICSLYLLYKTIVARQQSLLTEGDLEFRLVRARLDFPFVQKSVLGIAICIYIADRYTLFSEHHIVKAVRSLLPEVNPIKESYIELRQMRDPQRSFYLEIEKENGDYFSSSEIRFLKEELKETLHRHVEKTFPCVFGICNLEENMRNTLALNSEVESEEDLPHIMIFFAKNVDDTLLFQVLLVRPVTHSTLHIDQCFKIDEEGYSKKDFKYYYESSVMLNPIAPNVGKEACTFYLRIPQHSYFLRSNFSFNFFEARQHILNIVTEALGEVRDFNGGIYEKQQELFRQFKSVYRDIAQKDIEILEDFFYSLNPPEVRVLFSLSYLTTLFHLYQEARSEDLPKKDSIIFKTQKRDQEFFTILRFRNPELEKEIKKIIEENRNSIAYSATLYLNDRKGITMGYIFPTNEIGTKFQEAVQELIKAWTEKQQNLQIFRISIQNLPTSLDPRFGGDVPSSLFLKMLFEGLMTIGKNEKPEFAIAKSVSISEDGKEYLFKLRKCYWTNGDLITAHDFCYSWKKILSPQFDSPFAYLFYIIKNAKKAKEGKIAPEELGIEAINNSTLRIKLEYSFSPFLKYICLPIFSPVNHRIDRVHPNWSLQKDSSYVSNGPFQFTESNCPQTYELKKNLYYWDHSKIKLNSIQIIRSNPKVALEMYNKGEIDSLGRPYRPWIPFFDKNPEHATEKFQCSFVYWYIFNVKHFLFQSKKIRQAFSLAIDRKALHSLQPLSIAPASSPLPLVHAKVTEPLDQDIPTAIKLFEEGLEELGITRNSFPIITLNHDASELRQKIAFTILKQWKEAFDIDIRLERSHFKSLFKKVVNGEFQIAFSNWIPLIDDPYYTLNVFKYSTDRINFPNWENKEYQILLEKSLKVSDEIQKNELLLNAEKILVDEMPIIPLIHELECSKNKEYVKKFSLTKYYNIDYKQISINNSKKIQSK